MDYNQAKDALYNICKWGGSGDEKEVKKILDYYNNTNLINEVRIYLNINNNNLRSYIVMINISYYMIL